MQSQRMNLVRIALAARMTAGAVDIRLAGLQGIGYRGGCRETWWPPVVSRSGNASTALATNYAW